MQRNLSGEKTMNHKVAQTVQGKIACVVAYEIINLASSSLTSLIGNYGASLPDDIREPVFQAIALLSTVLRSYVIIHGIITR